VSHESVWNLARRQHGVVARRQLLALGYRTDAIQHRITKGRLHRVGHGIYAVGRPELSQRGKWMAAVLSCGEGAVLSHLAAAALWELRPSAVIEVTVPRTGQRRRPGVVVHRRAAMTPADTTTRWGIPVTPPVRTLVDVAVRLPPHELEHVISQADIMGLVTTEALRTALAEMPPRAGVGILRRTIDRRTFRVTRSKLEGRFIPLARRAGLSTPRTRARVNGFEVDFHWPELGLIVETDGLGYHRTPAQQARDRIRDQTHTAAGFTPLRFTHVQVFSEPAYVVSTLEAVARRLTGAGYE
jgi:very-short-patch-repair endonuclease